MKVKKTDLPVVGPSDGDQDILPSFDDEADELQDEDDDDDDLDDDEDMMADVNILLFFFSLWCQKLNSN